MREGNDLSFFKKKSVELREFLWKIEVNIHEMLFRLMKFKCFSCATACIVEIGGERNLDFFYKGLGFWKVRRFD
jgi:hypothetical protein